MLSDVIWSKEQLQALGESPGDDVALLLRSQGIEAHRVPGDSDGQLRILLRVGSGTFEANTTVGDVTIRCVSAAPVSV